jgi:hypothetical protein
MKLTLLVIFAFWFLRCAAETPTSNPPSVPKQIIDLGFTTETLFLKPAGTIEDVSQLDAPPTITPTSKMKYPSQLAHGFIGRVFGYAIILPDGSVDHIEVLSWNNERFHAPASEYVRTWKFSVPRKNGRPVPAMINFEFLIAADRTFGPFITNIRKEPNQSSEPTAPSGRGSP